MPQLDPKAYAEIARVIDELEPEIDNLYASAKNFVSDQVERKRQYGERMFLSPKQIAWLKSLHQEFVGDTDFEQPKGIDGQSEDPGAGMDDEVPF